jgi:hypothetical protein
MLPESVDGFRLCFVCQRLNQNRSLLCYFSNMLERIWDTSSVFGPQIPMGFEKDWVPTLPGKGSLAYRLVEPHAINA